MKPIRLEMTRESGSRPMCNGAPLICVEKADSVLQGATLITTGIKFSLDENMRVTVESSMEDVIVLGHNMTEKDGLKVLVSDARGIKQGDMFARLVIVERNWCPVRFLEFSKEGGRMILGDAKEVNENNDCKADTEQGGRE
jgi:hypothetical protein